LFLDDDVEILDKCLLSAHRSPYFEEDVGAVAGFVDDPFLTRGTPYRRDSTNHRELVQNFACAKSQYTISVMGANMSSGAQRFAR